MALRHGSRDRIAKADAQAAHGEPDASRREGREDARSRRGRAVALIRQSWHSRSMKEISFIKSFKGTSDILSCGRTSHSPKFLLTHKGHPQLCCRVDV